MERNRRKKGLNFRLVFLFLVLGFISEDVEGIRIKRHPPPVLVKVEQGKAISTKAKPQMIGMSPLSSRMDADEEMVPSKPENFPPKTLYESSSRASSPSFNSRNSEWMEENGQSDNFSGAYLPLTSSQKAKLLWLAMRRALRRQRARIKALKSLQAVRLSSSGPQSKTQYYRAILPILYHYKLQKQAVDQSYEKYFKSLQFLPVATSQSAEKTTSQAKILNSTGVVVEEQVAAASDLQDPYQHDDHLQHHDLFDDFTNYERELEKQRRRLLEVFPTPQSEVPFGERTILMVRFPPVSSQKQTKHRAKFPTTYDIDGGPGWLSFGTPFDPWSHAADNTKNKKPKKLILAEADKPSRYGVIITQNFVYRPSIRFSNSDPETLDKDKADPLQSGPTIVSRLAKVLAEVNHISNSYFLSKSVGEEKKWSNNAKKPPFVIVHLDTYTRRKNETGFLGLRDEVDANYGNGTIIYPTLNNPDIMASTKFEFHNAEDIDKIFDKRLAFGHSWGNTSPTTKHILVYPQGIPELKSFLKLMYKAHQDAHKQGITKIGDLKKLSAKLERPAFPDSKPLLSDQVADRSTNWLHTSSVGIRSLSDHEDHFPYHDHPVFDNYDDHYRPEVHQIHYHYF